MIRGSMAITADLGAAIKYGVIKILAGIIIMTMARTPQIRAMIARFLVLPPFIDESRHQNKSACRNDVHNDPVSAAGSADR